MEFNRSTFLFQNDRPLLKKGRLILEQLKKNSLALWGDDGEVFFMSCAIFVRNVGLLNKTIILE